MLKYAIILLDNTSTSFCHADNPIVERSLMSIDVLHDAIFWAMCENLRIQFVYPDYVLPDDMLMAIDSIDHVDIKHLQDADVIVCNGVSELKSLNFENKCIALCLSKNELLSNLEAIVEALKAQSHLSIVIKDIDKMGKADFDKYSEWLKALSDDVCKLYVEGQSPQTNILTDRMVLESMNNCNAGYESITIAPNGKFYICPAFFYDNPNDSVGDIQNGLDIHNPQLYRLDHAPICRKCDAYQCKRCVWLNRKTTFEVNTPSHEQCVAAHLERNASKTLLSEVRKHGEFLPDKEITEIDYLDPFDKIVNK